MKKSPVTVIMLTLNEEFNLSGAIKSIKDWVEDIFIVDSCSTDRTVDIALEHGVSIVQRTFTHFGDQWNWAIERLPIKTPWVLKLDADERVSAELKKEIEAVVSNEPEENAFVIPVRLWFMGKRMHPKIHAVRLWRRHKARYSHVIVNEHLIVDDMVGRLKNCIEHLDSPNLHRWYEKQNRYTTMEAIMRVRGDAPAAEPRLFGSSLERRMMLKNIFYRVPFRYQMQWLHEAFFRGAIWDGAAGRRWIRLRVEVMRAIELKMREMRTTGVVPEIPKASRGNYDSRILASPLQKIVSKSAENAH